MSTINDSIINYDGSSPPPTLTSAQSSGALLNYSTSSIHVNIQPMDHSLQQQQQHLPSSSSRSGPTTGTSSFRPLSTIGMMKNMTASDSSLMSATTTIAHQHQNQSGIGSGQHQHLATTGLSANQSFANLTASSTSSPKQNRRGRKKTADSAIHGCVSGSDSDGLDDDTTPLTRFDGGNNLQHDLEPTGYDNESIQPISSIDDVVGSITKSSSTVHLPPPLPPRPVSEKRRQIKAEIVESEKNHYDTLQYIRNVYQKPLRKEKNIFTPEQMSAIFCNTRKLKSVHKRICKELQNAHKLDQPQLSMGMTASTSTTDHKSNSPTLLPTDTGSLEKTLMGIFAGELGETLKKEASQFCVNQKLGGGLEFWNQKRKDSRLKALFDNELKSREMPECRWARLTLQDLLGSVFQRPLRYPLLLDRLLHSTPSDTLSYKHLEVALQYSRRIVESVNEETKKAELKARLEEIIRKTDSQSPGSKEVLAQLTGQLLIHEGPLVWRQTKAKTADVLLILTNQMLLVLTRDSSGDRYSLKKHTNSTTKLPYRLDIRMDDLLTRDVATDPTAFFLVSKNQDVFYEFAATTQQECKQWKDAITGAINQYRLQHSNVSATGTSLTNINKSILLNQNRALHDLNTTRSITHSQSINELQSPPLLSPSASLLNRPLPKVPTEENGGGTTPSLPPPSSLPPPPPPPPPQQPQAQTSTDTSPKFAGTIQNIVNTDSDLVQFNKVKMNDQIRVHYATPPATTLIGDTGTQQMGDIPDIVFNDRWKRVAQHVEGMP